jgi:hypothetical protein
VHNFKNCWNGKKYPQTKIHKTTRIYDGSQANRETPLLRGRALHYEDTSRTSIGGDKEYGKSRKTDTFELK